jgi:hypothetical protein
MLGAVLPLPQYAFMRGAQLRKSTGKTLPLPMILKMGLGISVVVLVVRSLVLPSVGNGMPVAEGGPFSVLSKLFLRFCWYPFITVL